MRFLFIANLHHSNLHTGIVSIEHSAAYDTVSYLQMLSKINHLLAEKMTIILSILSKRRFLFNRKSRLRKQNNGLPERSVLSPVLLNIFNNIQSPPPQYQGSTSRKNIGTQTAEKHYSKRRKIRLFKAPKNDDSTMDNCNFSGFNFAIMHFKRACSYLYVFRKTH